MDYWGAGFGVLGTATCRSWKDKQAKLCGVENGLISADMGDEGGIWNSVAVLLVLSVLGAGQPYSDISFLLTSYHIANGI